MIAQIINLSPKDVFRYYSLKYSISEGSYSYSRFGLEIRNLSFDLAESLAAEISRKNWRVFKYKNDNEKISLLLIGSIRRFKAIIEGITKDSLRQFAIKLFNIINFFETYELTAYTINNKRFEFNNAYIMGILNVTPDSFSDGGKYFSISKAIDGALKMIDMGADIIDIGGESTRPGAEEIDEETEIKRVLPVIKEVMQLRPDAVLSIDTRKKAVADIALNEGVTIVNDVSGFSHDSEMIESIAKHNAAVVIMHMKGTPKDMQDNPEYKNVVEEVYDFLSTQSRIASKAGISNIFIDPGIGFGKRPEDNYDILRRLDDFKSLSYPILIGVSRKSFIGKILNLQVDERDIPTSMIESYSLSKGARILRTHNVSYGVKLREVFNKINNVTIE